MLCRCLILNIYVTPEINQFPSWLLISAAHGLGVKLVWLVEEGKRERVRAADEEQAGREVKLKADGRAGTCLTLKSVWSRFPHVFLSFFFLNSTYYAKKKRKKRKTLSGFNPLWPCLSVSFSLLIGCPPSEQGRDTKNPLKSFHSVSPAPCKQTEGAFRTGESLI